MRCTHLLHTVAILTIVATRMASAQLSVEPTGKNFHKIISLDRVEFRGFGASPDGRWLIIGTVCGLTACSKAWDGDDGMWIMPADGHAKPTRLLSPGYNDRSPLFFPIGDKVAFVSDRVSRDGSRKNYVMTVAIDPKTGQAAGPPRQISTDEASFIGQISPDGKWVTYGVPGEDAIKVVPATGGTSRTLVKMEHASPPFIWSGDGKTLYFVVRSGPPVPPYGGIWYKVSANGGPVSRAYENPAAMPYPPNTDMHVVFVRRDQAPAGVRRVELYDAKERLIGAADVSSDMQFFFPRGTIGAMYAAMSYRGYENSLLTLDGGRTRTLASSRFAWVDGWIDNATLTIDGTDSSSGRLMVATLDTAGHEGPHVVLPADAGGCCGWDGIVGSAVSFRRSRPTVRFDVNPLYIADARSGVIKELAPNAINGPSTFGRGGFYGDGDRFLFTSVSGQQLELRGVTTDGRSTLLRAFAKSDSLVTTAVHSDLVAWAIASHDSVTIFAARGPNGRPHRLTALRLKPGRFFELAWSFDATMLAIAGQATDPSLSVIHVDETGAPRGAPVVLNPRATEPWSLRWTPDNRSLVVTAIPTGARDEVVIRVPVDPQEAPTFYGRNDEWAFVSPDGKRVAYPAVRTLGTSIWRVDFVAPTSDGLRGKP